MNSSNTSEHEKIKELAIIAQAVLRSYEIRGVFRIIEQTPAGPKCSYSERQVYEIPFEHLYGGILLACPLGDRTNGALSLEISVRDNTLRVSSNASSADAAQLAEAYRQSGHHFSIQF